jgi:WD40 repeat protein
VIDTESARNDSQLVICKKALREIAVLPDDATLLTNDGSTVQLWDIASSESKASITLPNSRFLMSTADQILVFHQNESIRRFQSNGVEIPEPKLVNKIRFVPVVMPESSRILFWLEGKLIFADVLTGEQNTHETLKGSHRFGTSNPVTQDYVYALTSSVHLQSSDGEANDNPKLICQRPGNQVSDLCVSPDGGQVAIGWVDGTIDLARLSDGKSNSFSRHEISGPRLLISEFCFSSDGLRLASASDTEVRVWSTLTTSPLSGVLKHDGKVLDLMFNRSGSRLFTIMGTKIYCWSIVSGGNTQVELTHEGAPYSPMFSDDSRFLTSNSYVMRGFMETQPATHRSWDLASLNARELTPSRSHYVAYQLVWDHARQFAISASRSNTETNWLVWDSLGVLVAQHKVPMPRHHRETALWLQDSLSATSLIVLESMSSKTHNSYELWDWKNDSVVWKTSQEYGDETICGVEGDRLAIVSKREGKEYLSVLRMSDRSILHGPYPLEGNGELEAVQLLHNESAAICWRILERKLTSGAPIQKYELRRCDLGPELQISKPLVVDYSHWNPRMATDSQSFFNMRLNRTFTFLAESGSLVDTKSLELTPLKHAMEKVFHVRGSADGEVLLGTNSTGGQLRCWKMEDGRLLGESAHNGIADFPINGMLVSQLTDSQNLTLFLNSSLQQQLEEPVQSIKPNVSTIEAGAMSPLGDLYAARSKYGVSVREIPSDTMIAEIAAANRSDLRWIESWIGLQSKSDGGFRVVQAQEQLEQLQVDKPSSPIWLELYNWLQSNLPTRPMTPRSRWSSRHVNSVAASAGGELAKRVCLVEDPTLPDVRHMIAEELDSEKKPAESDYERMLANHLRSWDKRVDVQSIRFLLSAALAKSSTKKTTESNDGPTLKPLARLMDSLDCVLNSKATVAMESLIAVHDAIEKLAIASQTDRKLLDRGSREKIVEVLRLLQNRLNEAASEPSPQLLDLSSSVGELGIHFETLDFCNLIRDKKWEMAAEEIDALSNKGVDAASVDLARAILLSHRDYVDPSKEPSELDIEIQETSLSRYKPASVKAGWGGAKYDSVPKPHVILKSMHRPYARGIFAHAPSTYVYRLDQKWKRFQAEVSVQPYEKLGSVTFEVIGDGKSLWTSGLVTFKQRQAFDIDVSDVSELKLVVTDGGNGANSDWAIWLEPHLNR